MEQAKTEKNITVRQSKIRYNSKENLKSKPACLIMLSGIYFMTQTTCRLKMLLLTLV